MSSSISQLMREVMEAFGKSPDEAEQEAIRIQSTKMEGTMKDVADAIERKKQAMAVMAEFDELHSKGIAAGWTYKEFEQAATEIVARHVDGKQDLHNAAVLAWFADAMSNMFKLYAVFVANAHRNKQQGVN